jgi:hypothetical protein
VGIKRKTSRSWLKAKNSDHKLLQLSSVKLV